MRSTGRSLAISIVALSALACFVGCEGGGDTAGGSPSVDVTGFWEGQNSIGNTMAFDITMTADGSVTGEAGTGGHSGPVTGRVSGNVFTYSINFTDIGLTVTGSATVTGNSMTGVSNPSDYSFTMTSE